MLYANAKADGTAIACSWAINTVVGGGVFVLAGGGANRGGDAGGVSSSDELRGEASTDQRIALAAVPASARARLLQAGSAAESAAAGSSTGAAASASRSAASSEAREGCCSTPSCTADGVSLRAAPGQVRLLWPRLPQAEHRCGRFRRVFALLLEDLPEPTDATKLEV